MQHIISRNLVLQQHTLLELQVVGVLAIRKTESGLQVLGQVLLLPNGGDDGLVDSLLVSSFRLGEWVLLLRLSFIEELFLRGAAALDGSLDKVGIVDLFVNLNVRKKVSGWKKDWPRKIARTVMPSKSILVEVAITYAWFTRRRGTPLILKGPVTNNNPLSSCFKKTTLFPLNLPANKIKTVPGVIEGRSLVGTEVFLLFFGFRTSSAG